MTVAAEAVTVADTATALNAVDSTSPLSLIVSVPSGGVTVYVGASDVTTTDGFPVAAGESLSVDLQSGEVLYGIVATGTQAANVLRTGVG